MARNVGFRFHEKRSEMRFYAECQRFERVHLHEVSDVSVSKSEHIRTYLKSIKHARVIHRRSLSSLEIKAKLSKVD